MEGGVGEEIIKSSRTIGLNRARVRGAKKLSKSCQPCLASFPRARRDQAQNRFQSAHKVPRERATVEDVTQQKCPGGQDTRHSRGAQHLARPLKRRTRYKAFSRRTAPGPSAKHGKNNPHKSRGGHDAMQSHGAQRLARPLNTGKQSTCATFLLQ